jgi:hypothetical protein
MSNLSIYSDNIIEAEWFKNLNPRFSNIEKKSLQDLIIKAGDAVESVMRNGLERTQQDFNE